RHLGTVHGHTDFKNAPDYAFLAPNFTRSELPIGVQAGRLGTGSCPARRTVVGFARAKHKVLGICVLVVGRTEQLDVVDLSAALASDSGSAQALPNRPGELRKLLDVVQRELQPVLLDQEEPVAAPSHIPDDPAMAGHIHRDGGTVAITGNIMDGNSSTCVEL